jgi:hypothetical protein
MLHFKARTGAISDIGGGYPPLNPCTCCMDKKIEGYGDIPDPLYVVGIKS